MARPSKPAIAASEKPRILLVDDQQGNLLALEVLLDEFDATLVRAGSGNEALKIILNQKITLVLLDVQMPDMDGFEVARLMQQTSRSQSIPVIFVSAINLDVAHVLKGYECGAVDFLTKPIEPLILKSKVRIALELYRKRRELEISHAALESSMRELVRIKKLNELLLQSISEGILRLDAEGRIQYANPAAAALLGNGDTLLGSLLSEHLVGDEEEEMISEILAHCMSGTRSQFIATARRMDEIFVAEFTATALTGDDGNMLGVSMVFKDISAHHKLTNKKPLNDKAS
ncbi:MAG: response regulator [bacterium]|nr:response regulator [bacterium]